MKTRAFPRGLRDRFRAWAPVIVLAAFVVAAPAGPPTYHSPQEVVFSPDGALLAVSDYTAAAAVLIDPARGAAVREISLNGKPMGVAFSPDGSRLYVAECEAGAVAEIDAAKGQVTRRFKTGPWPMGLAVAGRAKLLFVANYAMHSVSVIDLAAGTEKTRVPVLRMPVYLAVTPDESMLVVGNSLPEEPSSNALTGAAVSLVEVATFTRVADVRLPPNSMNLLGVAVSPDGKWAYAVHNLGRTTLPTTQLERGWVNTNGITIIDLAGRKILATMLLDQISSGAANPWGLAVSPDGSSLWVTVSGTHEIGRLDLARLHPLLEGKPPAATPGNQPGAGGYTTIWSDIGKDPANREKLSYDLAALYGAGLFRRFTLKGNGPRGAAISPDGKLAAVAMYFSGDAVLVNTGDPLDQKAVPLGKQPEADQVRRGEQMFHDGGYCFQSWLSCATCHPFGRVDGLNWDLLNDGMGNPKNTRSLVWSHRTPPVMSLGVRASMSVASRAGFRFILFREPEADEHEAVEAYLRGLEPVKSPHLVDGRLSAKARKGKELFESDRTRCAECHPGPLFTDLKMYDVGTRGELDRTDEFDNPTLVEIWRTGPYLHDGSAATLMDVLTTHNRDDKHGTTSSLSPAEKESLVEYMLSL